MLSVPLGEKIITQMEEKINYVTMEKNTYTTLFLSKILCRISRSHGGEYKNDGFD